MPPGAHSEMQVTFAAGFLAAATALLGFFAAGAFSLSLVALPLVLRALTLC